ncbi:hypothetical protein [Embleya sp. NPDC050493]|uniref:hypothetical protein n=1 Tax=Embleya sp. NPDC050493 TaxID=3363989 RepID=UPI00379FED02
MRRGWWRGVALVAAGFLGIQGLYAPNASAAPLTTHFVQIVAHEDDDLLFMNPDISGGIKAGVNTTTIYLTAGEADADDPVAYARRRQAGVMAAYARMAGLTSDDPCARDQAGPSGCWTRIERSFTGGHLVEEFTLNRWTGLRLVFLDLPETPRPVSLDQLESAPPNGVSAETLDMDGDPDNHTWPQYYTRPQLVTFITRLLTDYGATTVRAQDSAPDTLLATPAYPKGDHQTHIAASRLTDEAVRDYGGINNRVVLEHYRDYNIADMPRNLVDAELAEKADIFEEYRPHDAKDPAHPMDPTYGDEWKPSEYSRAPRGTNWVGRDSAMLLHAFVVEGGGLFEWSQDNALNWHGPYAHGSNGWALDAAVSVYNNADGRMEVFLRRRDTGEIVTRFQGVGGGWGWGELGSPNAVSGPWTDSYSLRVSSPVVSSNADGRLQVFVRNAGGGISTRWQAAPNGAWNGWTDMSGSDVQGPPAVVKTYTGRMELFAPTRGQVLHWYQPAPNAPFVSDANFPDITAASGLSTGLNASGRIELFYRQPNDAHTMTLYQAQPDGGWLGPGDFSPGADAPGGVGEPAMMTSHGRMVAAFRNRGGGVSFSRQVAPDQPFGAWTDRGGLLVGLPAAGLDRDGNIVLLSISPGGQVFASGERADGSFSSWASLG